MTRKLPEEFKGKEIIPLCLASNLDEARRIESVLDKADIDYTFEITPITGKSVLSIMFGGIKNGVMFLVLSSQYDFCRNLLIEAGLSNLIIE